MREEHTLSMFIAGSCIGAGLMYLLDPRLGRSRRAHIQQKLTRAINVSRRETNRWIRDKRNRAQGVLHRVRGARAHEALEKVASFAGERERAAA